jgi:hypothetical protein
MLAVYALVSPWKWPKYRPPETYHARLGERF